MNKWSMCDNMRQCEGACATIVDSAYHYLFVLFLVSVAQLLDELLPKFDLKKFPQERGRRF